MLQNSVATNYAKAFFDIAVEDEKIDEYGQEIATVKQALSMNPEFFRLIYHPGLTEVQKKELLEKILTVCSLSRPTQEFLRILEKKKRIDLIHEIADSYLQMADCRKNIVTVIVTSVIPLSIAHQEELRDKLSSVVSSVIRLSMQVNSEIIGGLIIRIQDRVIDGSVRGRLDRLREKMGQGTQ
ncbi:ATP synthase F1 subunit delta [Candidatus Desantisbacteria bacterium]|nr:ATP synthase F1 subunit delta [Candidatus Desantisbacteria bacterium]